MRIRAVTVLLATLAMAMLLWCRPLAAQQRGDSSSHEATTESYGVAVTPAIYLINFLFLYMASPDLAADMPAYRAPIPPEVATCLEQNPNGCPYAELERLFDEQDSSIAGCEEQHTVDRRLLPVRDRARLLLPLLGGGGGRSPECHWPTDCRENRRWERLAPPKFSRLAQINEPLGAERAARLARLLGMDDAMVLTDAEYNCLIGTPPRTPDQDIIVRCTNDLTNSRGSAVIPLSSYGLSVDEQGAVRSDCAPDAPCLAFNALLAGPLEEMALECGFLQKFLRVVTETPFLEFAADGSPCQEGAEPACIVEAICAGDRRGRSGCAG